jgi:acylphosphatase
MAAGDEVRLFAIVRGEVQGVGFRYFVVRQARVAGVEGWVRNRPDGTVECLAQGPREAVERLREAIRRGPPGAWVAEVEERWETPAGGVRGFEVRW